MFYNEFYFSEQDCVNTCVCTYVYPYMHMYIYIYLFHSMEIKTHKIKLMKTIRRGRACRSSLTNAKAPLVRGGRIWWRWKKRNQEEVRENERGPTKRSLFWRVSLPIRIISYTFSGGYHGLGPYVCNNRSGVCCCAHNMRCFANNLRCWVK